MPRTRKSSIPSLCSSIKNMAFIKRGILVANKRRAPKSALNSKKPISIKESEFNYEKIAGDLEDARLSLSPSLIDFDSDNISSLNTEVSDAISKLRHAPGIQKSVTNPDRYSCKKASESDHLNRSRTGRSFTNRGSNWRAYRSLDKDVSKKPTNQELEKLLYSQRNSQESQRDVSYFINYLVNILEEIDKMDVSNLMLTTNEEEFMNMLTADTKKLYMMNLPPKSLPFDLVRDLKHLNTNLKGDESNKYEVSESSGISAGSEASIELTYSNLDRVPTERAGCRPYKKIEKRSQIEQNCSTTKTDERIQRAISIDQTELIPIKQIRSSFTYVSDLPKGEGKLYWYFWIPKMQTSIFHNSKDRRIQSIARSSQSIIYLLRDRRINIFGEYQQLVVIISPSEFQMTKCKNLLDEKFPSFKVKWGSQHQPQTHPDSVNQTND